MRHVRPSGHLFFVVVFSKENENLKASKPSEHPPDRGEDCQNV